MVCFSLPLLNSMASKASNGSKPARLARYTARKWSLVTRIALGRRNTQDQSIFRTAQCTRDRLPMLCLLHGDVAARLLWERRIISRMGVEELIEKSRTNRNTDGPDLANYPADSSGFEADCILFHGFIWSQGYTEKKSESSTARQARALLSDPLCLTNG